jgi:hypothetical protein
MRFISFLTSHSVLPVTGQLEQRKQFTRMKWTGQLYPGIISAMNLESVARRYIAFSGPRRIAAGQLVEVVRKAKQTLDRNEHSSISIFETSTSRTHEIDFRGTAQEVLARLAPNPSPESAKRSPGRPKLGVVPREVTLLPQHWDWLNEQPGGASVALRKLVEEARRLNAPRDRARQSQEAVYRFMTIMAGNLPNYEEALRAFYSRDRKHFEELIADWPKDIRDHTIELVGACA